MARVCAQARHTNGAHAFPQTSVLFCEMRAAPTLRKATSKKPLAKIAPSALKITILTVCVCVCVCLVHRNRSDFCDLRLRCPSRPPEIARFPRQEKAMLHCDLRVRWKVASDLRFRAAISEPKTPSFCGISGDLAQSTRKSRAIAIVRFWCAKSVCLSQGVAGGYLGLAASTRPPPVTALARLVVGFMFACLRVVSCNSICYV